MANKKINFTPKYETLDIFLREIRHTNPDAELEREYMKVYKSKDSTPEEKLKARNAIIEMNLKFVYSMAKGFDKDPEVQLDLVNVGVIGMEKAFDAYDLERDCRFCTFAKDYITREINYYRGNEDILVRQTNNMRIVPKVKKIISEFESENGRTPVTSEIENILNEKYGITLTSTSEIAPLVIHKIDEFMENDDENHFAGEMSFNNHTSVDNLYEDTVENDWVKQMVAKYMSILSDREKKVISMAFGLDGYMKECRNQEIASSLGITSERARQIKNEAMKKMQEAFARSSAM